MKIVCNNNTFDVNDFLFYGTRLVSYQGHKFKVPEKIGKYIDSFLNIDESNIKILRFEFTKTGDSTTIETETEDEKFEKFINLMIDYGYNVEYIAEACSAVSEFLVNNSILVDSVLAR